MPTDDGPDLRREALRIPMFGVVAEFEIRTVKEHAIVRMRPHEQQAYLATIDRRAAVFGDTVQREIKPRFEPVGHAPRPFGHPVERLVGYEGAGECGSLLAAGGKVVVQHEIEHTRLSNRAIVHLDLVGLGEGPCRCYSQSQGYHRKRAYTDF